MNEIFHANACKMLGHKALQVKVVGTVEVDLERLKEITAYEPSGVSEKHATVKMFWRMLQSFSNEQRA